MDLQATSLDLESECIPSVDTLCRSQCELDGGTSQPRVPGHDSDLPEPPEEPLQSDCCGTGCSPCVFDIYQDDLAKWKELEQLSPKERAARLEERKGRKEGACSREIPVALSVREYREFEVIKIEKECEDVFVYKFGLPLHSVLGVSRGQHMTLR